MALYPSLCIQELEVSHLGHAGGSCDQSRKADVIAQEGEIIMASAASA